MPAPFVDFDPVLFRGCLDARPRFVAVVVAYAFDLVEAGHRVAHMLTLTLRNLERDGLVSRTVTPSIPPRVDYELTELGKSLQKPICSLASWAMDNVETIHAAQARFDAQADKRDAA